MLADIAFIGYDLYKLISDEIKGCDNFGTNISALGLDVLGAFTPGATGFGLLYRAKRALSVVIGSKISKQLLERGWTKLEIIKLIEKPHTTRKAFNRITGNKATAYFTKDGYYVIRDNVTGEIVQISRKSDPNWIPDRSIVNPYFPKR